MYLSLAVHHHRPTLLPSFLPHFLDLLPKPQICHVLHQVLLPHALLLPLDIGLPPHLTPSNLAILISTQPVPHLANPDQPGNPLVPLLQLALPVHLIVHFWEDPRVANPPTKAALPLSR